MVLVPAPPSPVPIPVPLPHPFIGIVFDPMGAMVGAAIGVVLGGGGLTLVNGLPVGNTGTAVRGIPHFPMPPGVSFAPFDVPGNDGVIVTGSKTVTMAGASAGRLTSMVMSCNFPINLPTSVCLAVPMGPPVLVGGPDSFDILAALTQAIRTKWVSDKLHALFQAKPGSWASKIICFLTGHPVDVVSGQVLTDGVDFDLPGPIPLRWERNYYSRSEYIGPLGAGWHHPLDMWVSEQEDSFTLKLPDGREDRHDQLRMGERRWEERERYWVGRSRVGYSMVRWDGIRYEFDPQGKQAGRYLLRRIVDLCGNIVELNYQESQLITVKDSGGRELRLIWTQADRLESVLLKRRAPSESWAELVRYQYHPDGNLAAVLDPNGNAYRYEYQGGVLVKETNRGGLSFYFEYDWFDRTGSCVRTWGDGGIYERRLTYDKLRRVTLVEDSRGGRTHYYGNAAGLVDVKVDALGGVWRWEWDEYCRQTAETDPLGQRREWQYDSQGNCIAERDSLGRCSRWLYGEWNRDTEYVAPGGGVWHRAFDSHGQLISSRDPLDHEYSFQYDRRGNLTAITNPLGKTLSAKYNTGGELTERTDWSGAAKTTFEYDDLRRLSVRRDPVGGETYLYWDACNRLQVIRLPDGASLQKRYDASGNVIEAIDASGVITKYRYSGINKLIARTAPDGTEIHLDYDTEGNLVCVTNEVGEKYRYEYDLLDRRIRSTGFDDATIEYRYDLVGNCIEQIDSLGRHTKFIHDPEGRPRQTIQADGSIAEIRYDEDGRMVFASQSGCTIQYELDALGQSLRETINKDTIERRYDAVGNCIFRRINNSPGTSFDYDANGRLQALLLGAQDRLDIHRDLLGRETRRRLNSSGLEIGRTYDQQSRIIGHDVGIPAQSTSNTRGHGRAFADSRSLLVQRRYTYDQRGNLQGLKDLFWGETSYTHNATDRLCGVQRDNGSGISYSHTPTGDVNHVARWLRGKDRSSAVHEDWEYAVGGKLIKKGEQQYHFNAAGYLLKKEENATDIWRYEWTPDGRLDRVHRPDGVVWHYSYDPFGRRIAKHGPDGTTRYIWDGDVIAHEENESRGARQWFFEPDGFVPILMKHGEKVCCVVTDHNGTPWELFEEDGTFAWRARRDSAGDMTDYEEGQLDLALHFQGQWQDNESNLSYNRFRYYEPLSQRYISRDPIGIAGGGILYGYVPSPVNWIDPYGLATAAWFTDPIHSVYSLSKDGVVYYVGRTADMNSSLLRHLESGRFKDLANYEMKPLMEDLTHAEARGLEQHFMDLFKTRTGEFPGNIINGIRPDRMDENAKKYRDAAKNKVCGV